MFTKSFHAFTAKFKMPDHSHGLPVKVKAMMRWWILGLKDARDRVMGISVNVERREENLKCCSIPDTPF